MLENVNRPDLRDVDPELSSYIIYLERIIEGYRDNGAVQFMAALNRKLKKLATQMDDTDINFGSSDDKLYDRFLATAKVGKDLASDFKSFLLEYGDKLGEEDSIKKTPLVERKAQERWAKG